MTLSEFKKLRDKCAKEDYVINPNYHITSDDFYQVITEAFLPKDFIIADPISGSQVRAVILDEILTLHKKL